MDNLAICDKKTQKIIENFAGDTLDTIIQFDNTAELFKSELYRKATGEFSGFISGMITHKYEENYHNNLNIFEKNGFISKNKVMVYEKNHSLVKGSSLAATQFVMAGIPVIAKLIGDNLQQKNFEKFFLMWTGYINQTKDITPLMVKNIKNILSLMQINKSEEQITFALKGYTTAFEYLPKLSKRNISAFNSIEKEQLKALAKQVISTADLDNISVKERALEFICEMFNISYIQSGKMLEDIIASQEYLTTVLKFSSVDYMTFFQQFTNSIEDAKNLSQYDVSMDIYAQQRIKNKKMIVDLGSKVLKSGAKAIITENPAYLLEILKPTIDVIEVSESLMSKTLNQDMNSQKGFELMKAIVQQRKFYDIPPSRK